MTALAPAVESFFTGYLIGQRGASPHTIASYRDTLRLLFAWIREQSGTRPSDLDFTDVDAATVTGFLAMLEDERHNTGRTRSQRLAAIHSLFRHAALGHPEHAALIARVLAIRPRKPSRKTVSWLTADEADALLAAPDPGTWTGRRDRLLMLLMLTSGPRVSEVTALTWADLSPGPARRPRALARQRPEGTAHPAPGTRHHRAAAVAAREPRPPRELRVHRPRHRQEDEHRRRRRADQDPRRSGSRRMSRHRRQERYAPCPQAHFRDAPAIRRSRWAVHRSPDRPRVPGVNTSLPARRPRAQAEGTRPDRPAAHQDRAATRPRTSSSPSSKACETMPDYAARAPP